MIAARFEDAAMMVSHLDLEEEFVEFDTARKKGGDYYFTSHAEKVLHYPLEDENGNIVNDVRIHPESNKIAYRVQDDPDQDYYANIDNNFYIDQSDGSKWYFVKPAAIKSGYRINWYDNAVLRTNLVRAGYHPKDTFFINSKGRITSKEISKSLCVDTYNSVVNTYVFGPQGEGGLQIGSRLDVETREKVTSLRLEDTMVANTRYENKTRGVKSGIFMPDGSVYDPNKAHQSPRYDSQGSFQMYNFNRALAPDVAKSLEQQADERYLKDYLPGLNLNNPNFPVYGMVRSTYKHKPTADPVAFLGFDDRQGQLRRALMIRLDGDLENFRYNGQTLEKMLKEHESLSVDNLHTSPFYHMMEEQGSKPDALIRTSPLRKWRGLMDLEKAFQVKESLDWDMDDIEQNVLFLKRNPALRDAILDVLEVRGMEVRQKAEPANPMMEEQWTHNGFGDLDYIEEDAKYQEYRRKMMQKQAPEKGALKTASEMIHERATHVYDYMIASDELLHRLILHPHPVEWNDAKDNMNDYQRLFKDVYETLKKKDNAYVSLFRKYIRNGKLVPPASQDAVKTFRDFGTQLLLSHDLKERNDSHSDYESGIIDVKYMNKGRVLFTNPSRDFRIVDERGRELSIDYIESEYAKHSNTVINNFDKKRWRIQFYRLSSEPSITAILMKYADTGRLGELDKVWQDNYAALKRLYLNGAPNEQGVSDRDARWFGLSQFTKQLKRIEVNAQGRYEGGLSRIFRDSVQAGAAEIYLKSEEGQRCVSAYGKLLNKVAKDNALTEEDMALLNYDPETHMPYDRIQYEVPAENFVIIDVPDTHLRAPLHDSRQGPYSLVIPRLTSSQKDKIKQGASVVLRGKSTGQMFFAGPSSIKKAPSDTGSYTQYFEQAKNAYREEGGVSFPRPENRRVMVIESLVPLAASRALDTGMQTIKIPSHSFDALVAPRLSHMDDDKPLTGLVMPAYNLFQPLEKGKPIRFREMDGGAYAKIEGVNERETGHTYESRKLKKIRNITVGQLYKELTNGKFKDLDAQKYGYASAYDLWEKVQQVFVNNDLQSADQEEIVLLEFEPVKKDSWAYFNAAEVPKAAFVYDGKPTPPSAYRLKASNEVRNAVRRHERAAKKAAAENESSSAAAEMDRKIAKAANRVPKP